MTFKERLCDHIGEIVCLKTELFWYDINSWDGIEERICLLLDAQIFDLTLAVAVTQGPSVATALLFIDDSPKWVNVCEGVVEFIQ